MGYYIGVDIIEISRIKKATARWGNRFLHRVYTARELELCQRKHSSLAARFAGKEAAIKTLADTRGISWQEIEVLSEPSGKPLIRLHGRAKEQARFLGLDELTIALSHSREYAIAFVIGETR